MFQPRPCGCKGVRSCLICEADFGIEQPKENVALLSLDLEDCYEYCSLCGKAWKGVDVKKQHPAHEGDSLDYPGVLLLEEFVTLEEELLLVEGCDKMPWDLSQSGRRKQNFGPKTNFKKMKMNGKGFEGFPKFSEFGQQKLSLCELLKDFQTIEQCAIEYRTETGACIDPHIDDCWVWGERVISLSLISDSVLTMSKYVGNLDKYNLRVHYNSNSRKGCSKTVEDLNEENGYADAKDYPTVRIPMPARSLLVLYGPARYEWEHSILRRDIQDRRICMAYREFTPEYLPGGELYENFGKYVCLKAQQFWN